MHLANHGLPDDALLNMYDVFQKATDVETKTVSLPSQPINRQGPLPLGWVGLGDGTSASFWDNLWS